MWAEFIDKLIRMYHVIAFQHTVSFLEGFKHTNSLFKHAILLVFVMVLCPHRHCKHAFCYLSQEYTYRSIGKTDFMTISAPIAEI